MLQRYVSSRKFFYSALAVTAVFAGLAAALFGLILPALHSVCGTAMDQQLLFTPEAARDFAARCDSPWQLSLRVADIFYPFLAAGSISMWLALALVRLRLKLSKLVFVAPLLGLLADCLENLGLWVLFVSGEAPTGLLAVSSGAGLIKTCAISFALLMLVCLWILAAIKPLRQRKANRQAS